MVPHSLNSAYSDNDSQISWEDGERVFRRGWQPDDRGRRRAVLIVQLGVEHPSRASLDRLAHEYELKDQLDGKWAARPLELVRDADRAVLVLEDAGGEPLDRLLGATMEVGRFLNLAIAIAAAVGKLHQSGIVHKDIKPANILVNVTTDEVRLTGFGIASRLARERQSPHPAETISGTLAYMAPEQTGRMNRSIDSRSDLYALGVTFYQMLTGALPFAAADAMEWVHCHLAKWPLVPAERVSEIPEAISAVVMKLLAKVAEDRYQTAAGLENDLRRCQIDWRAHRRVDGFSLGKRDIRDRLLIPEKLYGREREIGTLLAAFDRVVKGGTPELVLVSGYSGVGKSSVVNELQPVLVPPRGLFAGGKFDQYKGDVPYSTLAQAFQGLVRPLLAKSDTEFGEWREALREALGPNGQLMVDLVPDLKFIIGEQEALPELSPLDAQRRFFLVFERFLAVFARAEHPLALFLDDLQWLDAATLELLEHLLTEGGARHLLLIGAYRDNEVTSAHPLIRALDRIRTAGAQLQEIVLAPLAEEHIVHLIADTIHCGRGGAAPLAALVHEKTAGNPFFIVQFLSALGEEGLLTFDHSSASWSWDLAGIHAKGYTDNVIDLMIGKLSRLPASTQKTLQRLACLGSTAEFAQLAMVREESDEELRHSLREALRTELVLHSGNSYRFLHDRVQEAAYSLIPEARRAEAHLRIGRLLAAHTPLEKREEAIFEIVNQLNRGAALITAQSEKEQLADFNLLAGRRAKAATANVSALRYFVAGAAVMPDDAWERRPDLMFALELHRAECEFLTGALTAAEERLTMLTSRAATIVDQAALAGLRIELCLAESDAERAVEVCLGYLRHLGIEWTAHPTADEARREYERIWFLLEGREIEALIDLPIMGDLEALATMEVLTKVTIGAMNTDANLYDLVICRMVNLSLEHGNTDASCAAYVCAGAIAGRVFGDYKAGFGLGLLGRDLVERRALRRFQVRTYLDFVVLIIPWTQHLRTDQDLFRRVFDAATNVGELMYATYACMNLNHRLLAIGDPLADVQCEAEKGLEFTQKARVAPAIDVIATQLAFIRNLRGTTKSFGCFDDGQFSELEFEGRLYPPIMACWYWIRKLQARIFAGDYAAAAGAWQNAQELLWASPSFFEAAEARFYGALSLAASCDGASPEDFKQRAQAISAHYRVLAEWAENCPENFESRTAIIGAEMARIENRELDAERLYEKAIRSARANGFVHIEGLAKELAARFYAARDFRMIANAYLREARSCYLRWGADGKVRQLDHLHPWLRQGERAPGPTGTIEVPVEQLDIATVIEISQALSGEVVLEKLIDRLMRAAIKHAGADRGLLICPRSDELMIYAEATAHGEDVAIHVQERDGAGTLPESLVRYILRTGETVVLDDASAQNSFSADPYIVQRRARSILCLPMINQGRFVGVLYFENNLVPEVFTPDRLTVLKVLASQAAISLENIGLYGALADREAKVRRLVDANIIGIFVADLEGGVVEANDAFLRIIGYDREDLVSGRIRWNELTPPEWHERDIRTVADLKSTGTVQPFEKEYIRQDGSRVPVLIGAALFKEGGGECVAFVLDLTERKRAEGALKQSETRYQNLFQAMAVSFFELDYTSSRQILRVLRDAGVQDFRAHFKENPHLIREIMRVTRVIDVNDQTVSLFGRGNKEELLTSVGAFWPEESLDDYTESVLATIEGNDKFSTETRVRRLDGTIFDARFTLRYATEDKTRGLAGVIDITERKRAEEALRESERSLRAAIDGIPGYVAILAPNGETEAVNRQILEYYGQSVEELRKWGTSGVIHPEDLPYVKEIVARSIASGAPFEFEHRARRFDGEFRWLFARGVPFRDSSGRVTRWYCLLTDIEQLKRAEGALQESEAKFRAAIDGIAGLVAIMAPSGELESVNRPIIEYFGRSLEELKDWGTGDAVHPEDLPRALESFKTSFAAGTPFHQELRLRRFDGEYRWFENRGAPIRDESGQITRWYCLLTDIEDRTRALARLQQMQSDFAHINRVSTMGELAASLSHEILHPIATARNNARAGMRFLELKPPNLAEAMEALSCVVRDADRAGDIVGRMRDQIKKAPPRSERFELNKAVGEAIAMVRGAIARSKITLSTNHMDGLVTVEGDRVQLQQVVVNLILNAVDAMSSDEKGPRELSVSVEQGQTDGGVLVQVRDSGPGIAPEVIEQVFEPFYTTKTSGVGMGLSICRSILNAHGGRLWAAANAPRGAVFQFTLPAPGENS